jgi:hypothetical protein
MMLTAILIIASVVTRSFFQSPRGMIGGGKPGGVMPLAVSAARLASRLGW